jgi:GLPGLI family protein
MKKIFFAVIILLNVAFVNAQQFIDKATIEYEVKTNVKKKFGDSPWFEQIKDNMPTFRTQYFNYTFANNKSIYKLTKPDEKAKIPEFMDDSNEANEYYADYNTQTLQVKKMVIGSPFYIKDSIRPMEWKLINENMSIAGFNCRKAVGKIFDSVYVFVYYTEEISVSGGPCNMSGLPGVIMGMTIPRLFTSWIATKVMLNGVDEASIKPAANKKPQPYSEFRNFLIDKTKDWGDGDDGEFKHFKEQFLWGAQL